MDWSNEEYVRLYTRETADDLDLSWEAVALWRAMLTKFDRSGLLVARNGWLSVSRLVRMPAEVVERVGPELVQDGRIKPIDGGFFAPNYVEAQTASKSDKVRQKESRDRRRAHAASQVIESTLANGNSDNTLSQPVTSGHAAVTPSHAASQNVTLCSALLCSAEANAKLEREAPVGAVLPGFEPPPKPKRKPGPTPTEPERASAHLVLDKLSAQNGVRYSGTDRHVGLIVRCFREGITETDLRAVIGYCALELRWKDDPKMHQHLCPETLFGPEKIYKYLDPARTWFSKLGDS